MPRLFVLGVVSLLWSVFATSSLLAEEGTLRFQIQIEQQLLKDAASPSDTDDPTKLVPCPGVFVVLDERLARIKPYGERLKPWLNKITQPREAKPVTVKIEEGQFVPRLLVIRTGDPIIQGDYVHNLAFETFANPAFGTLGMPGTKYTFSNSEPTIVKFRYTVGTQVGYLAVKNHPYAAISNDEGKISFAGMPREEKLPMRVFCPLLQGGSYQVTSEDGQPIEKAKLVVEISNDEVTDVKLIIRSK